MTYRTLSCLDRPRRRVLAACCLVIGLAANLTGRASADSPRPNSRSDLARVLILAGEGAQTWRETTPELRRILADTGRFDVKVCESPQGLNAQTLAGFDLLVDNGAGLARGGDSEKAVARFVESGKGLLVAHGALGGSPSPEFWPVQPGASPLPPVRFLDVTIEQPDHPITRGLAPRFRTADSLPRGLRIHPDSERIATAGTVDAQGADDDRNGPAIVVRRHGRGRLVYFALGHNLSAMHEPTFIAAFARAAEWAATAAVTLPATPLAARPAPGAVRGLLITGGHDHEATFYSLFEGYRDLEWLPVDVSTTAFRKDLRDRYDVVIMYDFTRDMDDACKKNLRDFVESGKGVVVLHHALLNYQAWPWWSEEVVGGRYRLSPEGKIPSSSVKDNQQICVRPQGEHPVVAGIEPFQITDETYKRMWISDRVRPLLTTDNPTSDRLLAWIGPSETSRVVVIQLGHGHTAFGHPSYRTLVHNAILWAAGKTK